VLATTGLASTGDAGLDAALPDGTSRLAGAAAGRSCGFAATAPVSFVVGLVVGGDAAAWTGCGRTSGTGASFVTGLAGGGAAAAGGCDRESGTGTACGAGLGTISTTGDSLAGADGSAGRTGFSSGFATARSLSFRSSCRNAEISAVASFRQPISQ
jgi:hypothetical protein